MERLKNKEQLTPGGKFYYYYNGKVEEYKVLCFEPDNPDIIYAENLVTNCIERFTISELIENLRWDGNWEVYVGDYDIDFFIKKKIEYHKAAIKDLEGLLNAKK